MQAAPPMFSSIKISSREGSGQDAAPRTSGPTSVFIAAARPLLHLRGPPMPAIAFPSTSLHVDRHKIVAALTSCGAEIEVTYVPEFTRDAVATAIDVFDATPDVIFLCGTGTSWDSLKVIVEDGFGTADFVDMQTLQLVIPQRPKLLVAVGAFCEEFGATCVELGVCSTVLVLDDTTPPGASDSYQLISQLFKELVRVNGAETTSAAVKRTVATMEELRPGTTKSYARVYTSLRAVAPPQVLACCLGGCRVKDAEGSAAIRAQQNPRVFRLRTYDSRSQIMHDLLDAFEKRCTHSRAVLHGGAGCGRTELAAQVMLWYLDRSRLSAAIWANCDPQSDVAHYVHDLDSFYDLCGALLQLGMAGRQSKDMREQVLLRALKSSRALVVVDDWHRLSAAAQRDLAQLIRRFPPAVRVLVTVKGAAASTVVGACRDAMADCLCLHVAGVAAGGAERLFFEHMERAKLGPQHTSLVRFQNPYHRAGTCVQLGDLGAEERQMLTHMCSELLGPDGTVHVHSLLMLAATAASSEGGIYDVYNRYKAQQLVDYGAVADAGYGAPGTLSDVEVDVLWPAMCVAHGVLSERHRLLVALAMQVMMPVSVAELAMLSGETPQAVESMCALLHDLRLTWTTPQGLVYVVPAVRDGINLHMDRRLRAVEHGGLVRAEDFDDEPWVAALSRCDAVGTLKQMCKHLQHSPGAWAQVACSKHMLRSVEVMQVDLNKGAPEGSITLLYESYDRVVWRWYMEWERGGMVPPGAYEACLDGRHGACRPLPAHYNAVRDLLLDISALSSQRDRQEAASEVLSNMLFAIGEYDLSKRLLAYHSLLIGAKDRK